MKQLGANEIADHRNWCLVVKAEEGDCIGHPDTYVGVNRMLERFTNTFAEINDQTQLYLCFAESGNCNNRCFY